MAILIIFRKSCDLPSEQFLRIPNGQWYKTECVYIESMHGARCGLGLKPVKAIQIVPELKRKFHINQCYLFSVSTVPPANMFGVEALYPDRAWCRLTLGWARYGTLHCPLHCAQQPPGESHSHINIALLEVVLG